MSTIERIRRSLTDAAVFLDFDGTLSQIVRRPEQALAAEGVRDALESLAARAALVAIVTGRPRADVDARLDAKGVEVHGLYGLEAEPPDAGAAERVSAARPRVEAAAASVPGAWVERKGLSLAVHFREAPDPSAAEAALVGLLSEVATETGLHLLPGKRVLELAAGRPSKGGLVERLSRQRAVQAVLFAGDDVADLDAFDALDRLSSDGVDTLRVAVRGPETPQPLLDRADLQVLGPGGLVSVLAQLVD